MAKKVQMNKKIGHKMIYNTNMHFFKVHSFWALYNMLGSEELCSAFPSTVALITEEQNFSPAPTGSSKTETHRHFPCLLYL